MYEEKKFTSKNENETEETQTTDMTQQKAGKLGLRESSRFFYVSRCSNYCTWKTSKDGFNVTVRFQYLVSGSNVVTPPLRLVPNCRSPNRMPKWKSRTIVAFCFLSALNKPFEPNKTLNRISVCRSSFFQVVNSWVDCTYKKLNDLLIFEIFSLLYGESRLLSKEG